MQLRRVLDCICQVIDEAVTFAQSVDKNSPSLVAVYVVNKTSPKVPFNARLRGDTWRKYISLIRKPPYLLTPEQSLLIHTVMDGTDENSQNTENCLKFLLSLIDQQITSKAHECIFLSALSVLSIKDDMRMKLCM
jgi:type VI protein secretion system component Hcp